jgi:SAM-dependent methyltransferase
MREKSAGMERRMDDLHLYHACPLCDSVEVEGFAYANCAIHDRYAEPLSATMKWMKCTSCTHIFRSGYYTEEALKIVFRDSNENQVVGYDMEGQRPVSSRMIDRVLPYQSSGVWLDVGFGNGSLLFTADEYGFVTMGLDLRQQNVDAMLEFGVDARCVDIAELDTNINCAVISMADVLEHMPYPRKALHAAQQLLIDGGVLLLSMPNTDSSVWKQATAHDDNYYWSEIEHFHNFGRKRLYELLEEFSFRPVSYGISERYPMCMEIIALKAA